MCFDPPPTITLPTNLSDEAAAELLDFLYELTGVLENLYAAQIRRYHHHNDEQQTFIPFDQDPPF